MSAFEGYSMAEIAGRAADGELLGNPQHRVMRLVHPGDVSGPEDLILVLSAKILPLLGDTRCCAIVDRPLVEAGPDLVSRFESCLVSNRPRIVLGRVSQMFPRCRRPAAGIHPTAVIEEGAQIAEDCSIGPHVWIGPGAKIGRRTVVLANVSIAENAVVGEDGLIHPGAYIGDHVEIGDRVIIHPNAVVGGDGFAFETPTRNTTENARRANSHSGMKNELFERIASLGSVKIEDDVEIGACTTIDRSTLGATVVRRGTKIDNLVQIGHGNTIGSNVLLCAQVGLAGSCEVGDGAVLAGKVGVADHRKIGANSVLMAKSGVTRDIPAGEVYYGMPAQPVKNTLRNYSLINRLADMRKQIARLQKAIRKLSAQGADTAE